MFLMARLAACWTSGSVARLSKPLTVLDTLVMIPQGTPRRRLTASISLVDVGKKWFYQSKRGRGRGI